MEKVTLKADVRKDFGKSGCRQLRGGGQIPCVVYKAGKLGMNIQVDSKELWHALHTEAGENAIIGMEISDGDKNSSKTVIVQEVQLDPIKSTFVHVDFHEISLKEKLKVKVPVSIKGEAVGVKEEEGVLGQAIWELEVECLPTEIPEHLDANVEGLKIGDSVHVKDLSLPEGVVILDDPEQAIVTVHPPKAEEVEEEGEEVLGEETDEPEIIKKGKKEEEEGAESEQSGE